LGSGASHGDGRGCSGKAGAVDLRFARIKPVAKAALKMSPVAAASMASTGKEDTRASVAWLLM